MLAVKFIVIFTIFWNTYAHAGIVSPQCNLTDHEHLRQKRTLIFQYRGTIALSVGPVFNIGLGDPVPWRSLIQILNLQGGQYMLPIESLYPWDKWENIYARQMRKQMKISNKCADDYSRLFLYSAFENYINQQVGITNHSNISVGRQCLMRAICENTQVIHHRGILLEILNIVLTPGKSSINHLYKDAQAAGKAGLNCVNLYNECPEGVSLLDKFVKDY